jgi:hypothetical protein
MIVRLRADGLSSSSLPQSLGLLLVFPQFLLLSIRTPVDSALSTGRAPISRTFKALRSWYSDRSATSHELHGLE